MAPLVGGSKVVSGHGSVNLGGRQINVPQQLLHGSEVGASFEEVRGERVSECVRETCHTSVENTSDATLIQGTTAHTHEQRPARTGPRQPRSTVGEPPVDRPSGGSSDRHDALSVALARDGDEIPGDICDRERSHLRDTHAGGVQQFEQSPVS